ncbi:MAG: hypothetical protein JNK88_10495 [Mangrovicoccus sp.]|nr:hypothetical protein [Mangrovicoccus sp.]
MTFSEWERELREADASADNAGPGAVGGVAFAAAMSGVAFAGMTTLGAATLPALIAAPWLGTVLGLGVLAARTFRLAAPRALSARGDDDSNAQRLPGRTGT